MDAFGIFLIALAMVVGVVGTVLPFLPGLPIVWAAALVYGVVAGFGTVGWISFAIITLLAIGGMVLGFTLPHQRVSASGAPRSTVLIGLIAGIIGFFVIPVIGLPVGAIVGVYLAERLRTGDGRAAWSSTKNLIVGFGLGAAVQVSAGIAMIVCWVVWVVAG